MPLPGLESDMVANVYFPFSGVLPCYVFMLIGQVGWSIKPWELCTEVRCLGQTPGQNTKYTL